MTSRPIFSRGRGECNFAGIDGCLDLALVRRRRVYPPHVQDTLRSPTGRTAHVTTIHVIERVSSKRGYSLPK